MSFVRMVLRALNPASLPVISATGACFLSCSLTFAIAPPSQTATIVVRGFDQNGASSTGTFGVDEHNDAVAELAATIGLPTSDVSPLAPNQVAYTDYYGTHYPPYYTQQDIDELNSVTAQYGGGVPRYALIVAKFAREVMQRSGAKQINLFAPSFGALVSRWMIEKDVEGLASSGKIARWIGVEGVVCGNWIATQGNQDIYNFLKDQYDLDTIDLQHMRYDWIDANIHNPHNASDSPFLGQFETHFFVPADDSLNNHALTVASGKANDGVQLLRDEFFQNLATGSKYLGQIPTKSSVHATHESSKEDLGLRVAVAASLFGRKRVKITLTDVFIINGQDNSGPGEYVFGAKVYSPRGQSLYEISDPINDLRAGDHNVPFFSIPERTTTTINLTWFDDMTLTGEDHLVVKTDVNEIDYDPIYGISENILNPSQDMSNVTRRFSVLAPGTYSLFTPDWRGIVTVSLTDYPAFDPDPYAFSPKVDENTTLSQGWSQFGTTTPNQTTGYDAAQSALLATIGASNNGYRIIGWMSDASNTMNYSSVGTANFVRAKYYMYATGQTGSALNVIPNFRMRVSNRFAVNSILQVNNHLNSDPEGTALGQDIRPSTSPLSPSIYRVDLDPIDVPQLTANPSTEGFLRLFEVYEPDPQAYGTIGMTECVLGTYPALADSSTTVPVTQNGLVKSYRPGATDGGDFGNGNIASSNSAISIVKLFNGAAETTGGQPGVSISNAGVTLETLSVETDRFGAAALDVFNTPYDQTHHDTRARVQPNKQYRLRFHATATRQSNLQSVVRFRARTLKFQYTASLEVGGSQAASVANNTLAAQALPGVGNQIPAFDRINPAENGGWYNVMMVTPMNSDIQFTQPSIYAQDPPGVDSQPTNNSTSRRDLQFGFDVIDTFSTGPNAALEAGQMTVDRVDIEQYNLVPD